MENNHNQQPIVIFGGHVRTLSDWTPQDLEVLVDGSDGAKSPMTPKRFVSNWSPEAAMVCPNKVQENLKSWWHVILPSRNQTWQLKILAGWWFGTFFLFSHILGIIIPTDFHIFQRGRSTTNQLVSIWFNIDFMGKTFFFFGGGLSIFSHLIPGGFFFACYPHGFISIGWYYT